MWSKAISEQEQYDELACYTLAHPDPGFIHQNVVDAFGAQTATEASARSRDNMTTIGMRTRVIGSPLRITRTPCRVPVQLAAILPRRQIEPPPAGAKEATLVGEAEKIGRLRE